MPLGLRAGRQCNRGTTSGRQRVFLFSVPSQQGTGPNQPIIHWIANILPPGGKVAGACGQSRLHLVPKNECMRLYLLFPTRLHGVMLNEAQGHFTLLILMGYQAPSLQTELKAPCSSEWRPLRLKLTKIVSAGSLLGLPDPEDLKICLRVIFPSHSRS